MRIELLYFEGCPNYRDAHMVLNHVLQSRSVDAAVVKSFRVDAASATEVRFAGSPTIRVNGTDIEPEFEDAGDYSLRCRLYPTACGGTHIPDVRWIESAIDEALQRERNKETTA